MREGDTNLINKDSFLHLGGVLDTLLNHIAGKLVLGEVEHFAADAVHWRFENIKRLFLSLMFFWQADLTMVINQGAREMSMVMMGVDSDGWFHDTPGYYYAALRRFQVAAVSDQPRYDPLVTDQKATVQEYSIWLQVFEHLTLYPSVMNNHCRRLWKETNWQMAIHLERAIASVLINRSSPPLKFNPARDQLMWSS